MLYPINPPYTFFIDLIPEKKVQKMNVVAKEPLKTHSHMVDVIFVDNSRSLDPQNQKYQMYAISRTTEKHRLSMKHYLHASLTGSLLEVAVEYHERTREKVPAEVMAVLQANFADEIAELPERARQYFEDEEAE